MTLCINVSDTITLGVIRFIAHVKRLFPRLVKQTVSFVVVVVYRVFGLAPPKQHSSE